MCYESLCRDKSPPITVYKNLACIEGFGTWMVRRYQDARLQLEHSGPVGVDVTYKNCASKPLK